jgi:D-lactate dehydrogenase (cytochrome)
VAATVYLGRNAVEQRHFCDDRSAVGQGKMKYLSAEHGSAALAAMRAVKRALDPDNIMNPGKMLPDG